MNNVVKQKSQQKPGCPHPTWQILKVEWQNIPKCTSAKMVAFPKILESVSLYVAVLRYQVYWLIIVFIFTIKPQLEVWKSERFWKSSNCNVRPLHDEGCILNIYLPVHAPLPLQLYGCRLLRFLMQPTWPPDPPLGLVWVCQLPNWPMLS